MDKFTPGIHLEGRGGELVQSYNLLATFDRWTVSGTGDPNTVRLTVHKHEPDPYHLEHHDPDAPLTAELSIAGRTLRYPARLLSISPVLVLEIKREGANV